MQNIKCFLLLCGLLACGGCAVQPPPKPELTQLQIREFQTRRYDTKDQKLVMKAMLNVLQDTGFIVKNAQLDLGLLTATKETDVENSKEKFWAKWNHGQFADWKKNDVLEMSGNITEFGEQTQVRVNFQLKTMSSKGSVLKVTTIMDPEAYKDFFSRVDKGIFIQKEGL